MTVADGRICMLAQVGSKYRSHIYSEPVPMWLKWKGKFTVYMYNTKPLSALYLLTHLEQICRQLSVIIMLYGTSGPWSCHKHSTSLFTLDRLHTINLVPFQYKPVLTDMVIFIIKIRRSWYFLILITWIYIEMDSCFVWVASLRPTKEELITQQFLWYYKAGLKLKKILEERHLTVTVAEWRS